MTTDTNDPAGDLMAKADFQGLQGEAARMSALATRFIDALHTFERERDLDILLPLFAQDVELTRAPRAGAYHGKDGARRFWSEYLDAFESVATAFRRVTENSERVVLEWHSVASTRQGRSLEYDGCSVFERTETHVTRFWTYYDANAAGMGIGAGSPA